jgi:hypothetical protein
LHPDVFNSRKQSQVALELSHPVEDHPVLGMPRVTLWSLAGDADLGEFARIVAWMLGFLEVSGRALISYDWI